MGVALEPDHEVDAFDREGAPRHGRAHRVPLVLVERVDHRGPLGRADRDARLLAAPALRGAHRPEDSQRRELVLQRDRREHRRLRVVGHRDERVLGEELLNPAARVHDPRELQVGLCDRLQLRLRALLVGQPVVVWKGEQQEVEEVVLDEIGRHAAGVPVAHARHSQP